MDAHELEMHAPLSALPQLRRLISLLGLEKREGEWRRYESLCFCAPSYFLNFHIVDDVEMEHTAQCSDEQCSMCK